MNTDNCEKKIINKTQLFFLSIYDTFSSDFKNKSTLNVAI